MKTERNILIAFVLNLVFSIFEFIGGIFIGSVAIMSDSVHDFGDSISIGISFFLEKKSKKRPDAKHTYGYIRYSVIGSIITTMVLIISSTFVIIESIKRIFNPVSINYNGMIIFAVLGVIINSLASYMTRESGSLNQKSVNLHMLEDVLNWVIVLIGSILMKFTDIKLIDSIMSIGVAIFILFSAFKNLKSVIDIFLEVTPDNIDVSDLKKHILKVDGVVDVHHIHIRSIDGFNNYATLHVVVKKYSDKIKNSVREELIELGICHSTIEIELENEKCSSVNCSIKNSNFVGHHH